MIEKISNRLISLDVFRGATIALMILVNNPGDWGNVYPPLLHAKWNGCTPTDLVFPFFLFIVGVSVTLSLTKRKERGDDLFKLVLQIFRRSFLIFFIGVFLNAFPDFNLSEVRILGVLQRIALVYFFISLIFLFTEWKTQVIISAILLLGYWALITLVPVPGIGMPNISQPTIYDPNLQKEIAPNIVAWLDNKLLAGHLWRSTKIWDPEGLLSTLPAIVTGLFGVLLGKFLRTKLDEFNKIIWIFFTANILIFTGLLWDLVFPMNKSLWTSSYVLFTAGLALHFFAMCYWLIDVKKIDWWIKPFVVYGTNAITVYTLSWIGGTFLRRVKFDFYGTETSLRNFLYDNLFKPFFSPINASLAWAIFYVLFWLGIMWIFYKKKIFLKI
jgi:predicted acyltransferase